MGLSGDGALVLTELIILSGLIHLDKAAISAPLRGWIFEGKRYQLLSEDLGGPGILFLLPEEGERMCVILMNSLTRLGLSVQVATPFTEQKRKEAQ
jgi:hypothetical protein